MTSTKTDGNKLHYPRLMVSTTGMIVLFSKPSIGTVVYSVPCSSMDVGYYDDSWVMSNFVPYHGGITLAM